jgi:hypothetical protein
MTDPAVPNPDGPVKERSVPWGLVFAGGIIGTALVVAGIFLSPFLVILGALVLCALPFAFLRAGPGAPGKKYDLVSQAMARPFEPKPPSADDERRPTPVNDRSVSRRVDGESRSDAQ